MAQLRRRSALRRATLLVLVVASPSVLAQRFSQAPPPSHHERLSAEYRGLVERYRSGDDGAVAAVAAMRDSDLEGVLDVIFGAAVPGGQWTAAERDAAVVLHGDIALSLNETDPPKADFHLRHGATFLFRLGPASRQLAIDWYVGVATVLMTRGSFTLADGLLRSARDRIPDAPLPILFHSGRLAEVHASFAASAVGTETLPRTTSSSRTVRPQSRTAMPDQGTTPQQRRMAWLGEADGHLRKALSLEPSDPLARLHLGRVQMLRGNHGAALKTLEPLMAREQEDRIRYTSALFTGAIYDRQGDLERAQQHYRKASDVIPDGQAAQVALTEVMQRAGKALDAHAAFSAFMAGKRSARDPWSFYLHEPIDDAENRWESLRRRVRR